MFIAHGQRSWPSCLPTSRSMARGGNNAAVAWQSKARLFYANRNSDGLRPHRRLLEWPGRVGRGVLKLSSALVQRRPSRIPVTEALPANALSEPGMSPGLRAKPCG